MEYFRYLLISTGHIADYLLQMLPCACTALFLYTALLPKRRRQLARKNLSSSSCRETALLLFWMFCGGLLALTLFPAGFWTAEHWAAAMSGECSLFPPVDFAAQWAGLQLEPFREIRRGAKGGWVLFLVVANVGIFLPMGFFPALLWRSPRWWRSLLVGLCTSLCIEVVQFFIGRRSDIDDILLNTAGALLGFWLFCLLRTIAPAWSAQFQCRERTDL